MNSQATESGRQIMTPGLLANTPFSCSGEAKLSNAVTYNLHSACRLLPEILVCFTEYNSNFFLFGVNIDSSEPLVNSKEYVEEIRQCVLSARGCTKF